MTTLLNAVNKFKIKPQTKASWQGQRQQGVKPSLIFYSVLQMIHNFRFYWFWRAVTSPPSKILFKQEVDSLYFWSCFCFRCCICSWFTYSCWEWWLPDILAQLIFLCLHLLPSVHESPLTKQLFTRRLNVSAVFTRSGWSCERLWSGFASRFTTGPPQCGR